MSSWDHYLSEADRAVLARGRWAQRGGVGQRPVLLIIDAQNYMAGVRGGEQAAYPASCGEIGWQAIDQIARLLGVARRCAVPIVFTRLIIDPAVANAGGVLTRKIGSEVSDFMFFAGTHGSEIVAPLAPASDELVLEKKRFSAFFGTPLLSHLIALGVDTLIVTGGSTSNCVRATVVDGASFDFRVIVPREAVFDRIPVCHEISLFDMHRAYADVLDCAAVAEYLTSLAPGDRRLATTTR